MSSPPDLPSALAKIESLEREKRELEKRLETLGADLASLRSARAAEGIAGNRYKGRLVVLGFALVVLTVFGAAAIMYVQLRHEGPPPRVDMPGTPHGTGVPGFPPPPPDPGNSGTNQRH